MLEVRFYRDERGRLAGLSASGHAEFAEYGEDVVCAAVSAILQAARLGVADFAGGAVRVRQQPGELELTWPEAERERESIVAIVSAAELAVEQIARRYPSHVRLIRCERRSTGAGDPKGVTEFSDQRRVDDV
jgi:uncharacterized protein